MLKWHEFSEKEQEQMTQHFARRALVDDLANGEHPATEDLSAPVSTRDLYNYLTRPGATLSAAQRLTLRTSPKLQADMDVMLKRCRQAESAYSIAAATEGDLPQRRLAPAVLLVSPTSRSDDEVFLILHQIEPAPSFAPRKIILRVPDKESLVIEIPQPFEEAAQWLLRRDDPFIVMFSNNETKVDLT